eukprot:187811-Prymnesium_polylepis.2
MDADRGNWHALDCEDWQRYIVCQGIAPPPPVAPPPPAPPATPPKPPTLPPGTCACGFGTEPSADGTECVGVGTRSAEHTSKHPSLVTFTL